MNCWTHQYLVMALLKRVADTYAILIDSSKTSWRFAAAPFGLRRRLGYDFHLVHVVRDPRAVCWSAFKKAERKGIAHFSGALYCTFSTIGWWIANLACELFGWRYGEQYVRLTYEELARSPREAATELLEMVLRGDGFNFDALGRTDNRHQLHGNRMRSQRLFLKNIREDITWKIEMPTTYKWLAMVLSWPLRRKYGYR